MNNAWPAAQRLKPDKNASIDRLQFAESLEAVGESADYIQENAPEREDLKRSLHTRIDSATRADVLIASSTSGLLPSHFQAECRHPQRVLVGHPFNPVYLLPLVEVLGGKQTAAEAVDRAVAFYRSLGMYPLKVRTEIPGFLSVCMGNLKQPHRQPDPSVRHSARIFHPVREYHCSRYPRPGWRQFQPIIFSRY